MISALDAHLFAVAVTRGLSGLIVHPHNRANPPRPELPLELYEFEGCPFCRKVRDGMSELDLAYIARSAAKGAETKRGAAVALGGKAQFPLLRDPNTDTTLYESEAILDYLWSTYGPGRSTLARAAAPLNLASSAIASAIRPRGARVRPGLERREQPEHRLSLYQFEASPYCRKVREVLCELNLDCLILNVAKKSARRPELVALGGKMQVPFLVDPNTDTTLYESDDIVAYLEKTYGA